MVRRRRASGETDGSWLSAVPVKVGAFAS